MAAVGYSARVEKYTKNLYSSQKVDHSVDFSSIWVYNYTLAIVPRATLTIWEVYMTDMEIYRALPFLWFLVAIFFVVGCIVYFGSRSKSVLDVTVMTFGQLKAGRKGQIFQLYLGEAKVGEKIKAVPADKSKFMQKISVNKALSLTGVVTILPGEKVLRVSV